MEPHRPDRIRRVELASGEVIEVTTFEPLPDAPELTHGPDHGPAGESPRLPTCAGCASPLAYPIEWEPTGHGTWAVRLHCPECLAETTGLLDEQSVATLERALSRAAASMTSDLRTLALVNLEHEIDAFAAALRDDLILPEDF